MSYQKVHKQLPSFASLGRSEVVQAEQGYATASVGRRKKATVRTEVEGLNHPNTAGGLRRWPVIENAEARQMHLRCRR